MKFTITPALMEMVNEKGERLIESGQFKVYVGGSVPSKRSLDLGAAPFQEIVFTVE